MYVEETLDASYDAHLPIVNLGKRTVERVELGMFPATQINLQRVARSKCMHLSAACLY